MLTPSASGTRLLPPERNSGPPGRSSPPPEWSSPLAPLLVPDLLPPCLRSLRWLPASTVKEKPNEPTASTTSTPSVPELGSRPQKHNKDDVREEQVARNAEKMKSLGLAVISSDLNALKKAAGKPKKKRALEVAIPESTRVLRSQLVMHGSDNEKDADHEQDLEENEGQIDFDKLHAYYLNSCSLLDPSMFSSHVEEASLRHAISDYVISSK